MTQLQAGAVAKPCGVTRDSRGRFQRADRGLSVDVAEAADIDGMGDYDTGVWPEFPAWTMAQRPTFWQRIRRWARGAK
jgi:hypothetical protein